MKPESGSLRLIPFLQIVLFVYLCSFRAVSNDIVLQDSYAQKSDTNCSVAFSWNPVQQYTYSFSPESLVGNPVSWLWDFGDGNITPNANPVHSFSPGSYSVCLKMTTDSGCVDTLCLDLNVLQCDLSVSSTYQDATCFLKCDGTAMVVATGGTQPYSYQWTNGDSTATTDSLCQDIFGVTVTDQFMCTASKTIIISQPGPLSSSISKSDDPCHGSCNGSISVAVNGGTVPFSYAWSNGMSGANVTGLCAGFYSATINDANQCSHFIEADIHEPDTLIAVISEHLDNLCNGECLGKISILAGGGTGLILYEWSNSSTDAFIDSLCSGMYSVTVKDANNCPVVIEDEITEPPPIICSVNSADATEYGKCDGEAQLVVSGGTYPLFVEWSSGGTDLWKDSLCAGPYSVSVTDINLCKKNISFIISQPPVYILSGLVQTAQAPLPVGMAVLYKQFSSGEFSAMKRCEISSGGFIFDTLQEADYLVHVIPYFGFQPQVPVYLPTYNGNTAYWENADIIHLNDTIDTLSITLLKNTEIFYGTRTVAGSLQFEDSSYYESDVFSMDWFGFEYIDSRFSVVDSVCANIPVFLRGQDGALLDYCLTDQKGHFKFSEVPEQIFKIHPEKPGYTTIEKTIYSSGDDLSPFVIRDNVIEILETGINEFYQGSPKIFPNPATDWLNIYLPDNRIYSLTLVDLTGKVVTRKSTNGINRTSISLEYLSRGFYIIEVGCSDSSIQRFLISKI